MTNKSFDLDAIEKRFEGVDPYESESWEDWLENQYISDRRELQDTIEEVSLFITAFTRGGGAAHYSLRIVISKKPLQNSIQMQF